MNAVQRPLIVAEDLLAQIAPPSLVGRVPPPLHVAFLPRGLVGDLRAQIEGDPLGASEPRLRSKYKCISPVGCGKPR